MKPIYTLKDGHADLTTLDTDLQQLNPVCLDILYNRGFRTNEEIRGLLFPSLTEAIRPLECQDSKPALKLLAHTIRNGDHIVVYRDYDVDGISSGAVAIECLVELGAEVFCYANERTVDGYGICRNGIDNIMQMWPETRLILTTDNGITGNDAIQYAKQRGLKVIVTDHHEQGQELPHADAVIDLKRLDEVYPYHDMCGTGVIFRLMLDLFRLMHRDITHVLKCLDLVALATIADVVPLLGENRAYVQKGMELIRTGQRPFFKIMNQVFKADNISAHYTIAYQYAPAINALSRMGEDTALALDAMLSSDEDWITQQVTLFRTINDERKDATQKQYELALSMIDEDNIGNCIIVASPEFSDGIVGIIAGRIKEEFYRPAIVLTVENGIMKGSGRSLDGLNLKAALDECGEYLLGHGGHYKAAGLSLKEENYEAFVSAFTKIADRELAGQTLVPTVELAAVLDENTLTTDFVEGLRILEPFGEGFPQCLFGLKANPVEIRYMGKDQQHVKLMCPGTEFSIVAWNQGEKYKEFKKIPKKFIGNPTLNYWNGNCSVQFVAQ